MFSLANFSKSDRWIATIATWQVLGGAFSMVVFLDALRRPAGAPGLRGVIVTLGLIAALFAVISGLRLRKRRPGAIHQALVIQGLQLVGFSNSTLMVQLTLGPYVYATMLWGRRYALDVGVRPTLEFHMSSTGALPAGVAINLLALFCFMRLLFWELPTTPDPQLAAPPPSETPPSTPTMETL